MKNNKFFDELWNLLIPSACRSVNCGEPLRHDRLTNSSRCEANKDRLEAELGVSLDFPENRTGVLI